MTELEKKRFKETENTMKIDGINFTRNNVKEKWKMIIPSAVATQLVQETHENAGHPGRYKIFHILKDTYAFKI